MHARAAGDFLDDFYAIPAPRVLPWPDAAEFLAGFQTVYDWDSLIVASGGGGDLPVPLPLCTRGLPCALSVSGGGEVLRDGPKAALRRAAEGAVSCHALDGCVSMRLRNVMVACSGGTTEAAPVRVDGAALVIEGAEFRGCAALADGGAVQVWIYMRPAHSFLFADPSPYKYSLRDVAYLWGGSKVSNDVVNRVEQTTAFSKTSRI